MSRITDNLLNNKADRAIHRARQKMAENQEQSLSGKRINRPSDDPQSTVRILGLRNTEARNEQIQKNMELATSFLTITDGALEELGGVLVRAKELAIQMSSSSNNSSDAQTAVASEVEQLYMQAVQLGNARVGDRYVFGGYAADKAPFDLEGNYYGDDGVIELEVQPGQNLVVNMSGMEPFYGLKELPQQELPDGGNENGNDPGGRGPKVEGMRSPASIVAETQGVDPVEDPEAYAAIENQTKAVNVFSTLKRFMVGLKNGQMGEVQGVLEDLDQAHSQVLSARASIGSRQNGVDQNLAQLDNQFVVTKTLISNVEDSDAVKVFSDLARNETMLNATLEANKKLLTPSLLDFLK
jgi:flagellar hook-associated protein 3 FlgL